MTNVVHVEKSDVGATLSCWIYCTMWQLYAAEKLGLVGYVNWPNVATKSLHAHQDEEMFAKCPNMFEWWFKQPFYAGCPERKMIWEWEQLAIPGPGGENPLADHCLTNRPLSEVKAYYQKNLIFNAEVSKRAAAIASKYGVGLQNTIGVTWRGCEAHLDTGRSLEQETVENYFPRIDRLLKQDHNLQILALAEETGALQKILERYRGAITIPEFFSAPSGFRGQSGWINPSSGYERGVQTCCMIWILSRCKHYIKNKSNMSSTASYLSSGNVIHVGNNTEVYC